MSEHVAGWMEILDDGRIRVVTKDGVGETERPLPEPDPRILDGLPDGSVAVESATIELSGWWDRPENEA